MPTTQGKPTDTPKMPESPGTYVPDEVVTEIVDALDERLGPDWMSLFDRVQFEEKMEPAMMRRACIAAELGHRIPPEDWSEVFDPEGSYDVVDFIYSCIPAAFHYTPNFTSDTPGYHGPIFHIQHGGGPSFMSNVTRPRIDDEGNEHDFDEGFRAYPLDPH